MIEVEQSNARKFQEDFLERLNSFKPPVDPFTGKPSWSFSGELEKQMKKLYDDFASIFSRHIPEIPNDQKTVEGSNIVKVGFVTKLYTDDNDINKRRWVVVPKYVLPDGTIIEFKPEKDYLKPQISIGGRIIIDGLDHQSTLEKMKTVVNTIINNPNLQVSLPEIDENDFYFKELVQQTAKDNEVNYPPDEKVAEALTNIPDSVRKLIPKNVNELFQQFFPSPEDLIARPGDTAELIIINYHPEDPEFSLPANYRNYYFQIRAKRTRNSIIVPLETAQKSLETLRNIIQQDEEGLTIEFSPEFYERYQERISREIETVINFLSNSLDLDKDVRQKARELADKIRKLRKPDLNLFGMHLRGMDYSVAKRVSETAIIDLATIEEVYKLIVQQPELSSLMIIGQNTQPLKLTDYFREVISIITDLSQGKISDRIKRLLQGETITGELEEESQGKLSIQDVATATFSYFEVLEEFRRFRLELTIDISSDEPKYKLTIRNQAYWKEGKDRLESLGFNPEHVESFPSGYSWVVLKDGSVFILPSENYLNPNTGLIIYSENVTRRNKEEDLKAAKSTIQELRSDLTQEELDKIAEAIVNRAYSTITADPERLLEKIRQIIKLKREKPENYEEIDITELAAAFLPYHSSQPKIDEEKFKLFCRLLNINQAQVSTWCLLGKPLTNFRLYKINDEEYLGLALYLIDPFLNQNNSVGYSFVRGNNLAKLVEDSKQQLIKMGIPENEIEIITPPNVTIDIDDPNKGYTIKEAVNTIFG